MTDLLSHLAYLYGADQAPQLLERLQGIIADYRMRIPSSTGELTQRDSILITYGDQVKVAGERPLQTLGRFCNQHLNGVVSGIHILPFYPWTSDDGFSVVDYRTVEPALGDWEDITRMQDGFRLMFDAVINHVSVQHEWFQAFLRDDPHYRDYFIVVDGNPDLSQVVRPRALPLLTKFETPSGPRQVWTTFSADQVDLNFQNPDVLLKIVDTLLFYVAQGAQLIRLDAIAYLWKETGTACIHLPQTHRIIRLFRAVLDDLAPHVLLVTETNVPHLDNISYFGDGRDEAQMVYNFALPPLVLHTFYTGNSRILSEWAAGLKLPSRHTTFFNFLASHDGIGVNPARGILSEMEIDAMVERVVQHGGLVSYKNDANGAQIPYELNINYFDALSNPRGEEPIGAQVDRFMTAQAIMLALVGVPGIYFHSLFGSRSWHEGVDLTGRNRTINRQKIDLSMLESDLADESSLRHQVFHRYSQLLRALRESSAFDPHGGQQVLDGREAVFVLLRFSPDGSERVLCLHNISDQTQRVNLESKEIFGLFAGTLIDLITDHRMDDLLNDIVALQPYQTLWLRIKG
ncbi:MAG TPA: sugar phosphorylase [Anaerolineales bacterium]|nr:sugar phosphorylase [Anaerolineales bacterium]